MGTCRKKKQGLPLEIRGIEDFVDEHAGIGAEHVSMSEIVCALYYT